MGIGLCPRWAGKAHSTGSGLNQCREVDFPYPLQIYHFSYHHWKEAIVLHNKSNILIDVDELKDKESDTAATICIINVQWRSKALRGPGSTVSWGPSLSLPSTSPSFPPPPPFPSRSSAHPLALPRSGLPNPARGSGGALAVSSPSGVWGGAPAEIEFGAFYALCSLLLVFFRSRPIIFLPEIFLWPHYSGAPGARGPRFIEPPEAPVPTPLSMSVTWTTLNSNTLYIKVLMRWISYRSLRNYNVWRALCDLHVILVLHQVKDVTQDARSKVNDNCYFSKINLTLYTRNTDLIHILQRSPIDRWD